jgi:hypothetical protein
LCAQDKVIALAVVMWRTRGQIFRVEMVTLRRIAETLARKEFKDQMRDADSPLGGDRQHR